MGRWWGRRWGNRVGAVHLIGAPTFVLLKSRFISSRISVCRESVCASEGVALAPTAACILVFTSSSLTRAHRRRTDRDDSGGGGGSVSSLIGRADGNGNVDNELGQGLTRSMSCCSSSDIPSNLASPSLDGDVLRSFGGRTEDPKGQHRARVVSSGVTPPKETGVLMWIVAHGP